MPGAIYHVRALRRGSAGAGAAAAGGYEAFGESAPARGAPRGAPAKPDFLFVGRRVAPNFLRDIVLAPSMVRDHDKAAYQRALSAVGRLSE